MHPPAWIREGAGTLPHPLPRPGAGAAHPIVNRFAPFLAACILYSAPAVSDDITLTNGRSMRGIVAQETDQFVVLDVGVGSTRIERRRIAAVRRAGSAENNKIRRAWREKYFLHRKYVPPSLTDLASGYNRLLASRDAATRARRSMSSAERTIRQENGRIESLRRQLSVVSRQLKAASPDEDAANYNKLVHKSNSLRADITLKQEKIKQAQERQKRVATPVSGYITEVTGFDKELGRRLSSSSPGESDERRFLERLAQEVAKLSGELTRAVVPTRKRAGGLQVTTVLNGKVQGRLLLDTGASFVSISADLAARLGVNTNELPVKAMTVADGRQVDGRALTLKSVRVGDACARNVPAVVLPGRSDAAFDGLLGMSFLRNFAINIDGATGNLILSRFGPE